MAKTKYTLQEVKALGYIPSWELKVNDIVSCIGYPNELGLFSYDFSRDLERTYIVTRSAPRGFAPEGRRNNPGHLANYFKFSLNRQAWWKVHSIEYQKIEIGL